MPTDGETCLVFTHLQAGVESDTSVMPGRAPAVVKAR